MTQHLKFRGHTIIYQMDLVEWVLSLPCKLSKLPIMIVRQRGQTEDSYEDLRCRTQYLRDLLYWLPKVGAPPESCLSAEALPPESCVCGGQVHPELYGGLRPDAETDAVFARLSELGCDAAGGASIQSELGEYVLPGRAAASAVGPAQQVSFAGSSSLDMNSSTVLQRMPHAGRATMVQRSLQLGGELELSQDPDLQRVRRFACVDGTPP